MKISDEINERKRGIEEEIKQFEIKLKGKALPYAIIGTLFSPLIGTLFGAALGTLSETEKESITNKIEELKEIEHSIIIDSLKRSKQRIIENLKLNIHSIESRITRSRLKIEALANLEKLFLIDNRRYLLDTDHVRIYNKMIDDCLETIEIENAQISFNQKKCNELDKELFELNNVDVNKIKLERAKLRHELTEVRKKINEEMIKKEERIKRTKIKIDQSQIEKQF